ncbi:MAG: NAD-dependent epimerase/dehydratase family protein, partial [Pseudobdellovibrio sp.]
KILFIGGTKFVGRRIVEDALKLGHEVHLLQRGQTNASLFPDVKKYIGDRSDINSVLPADARFDLVIDSCGYHPDVVEKSCRALTGRTPKYVFISTISVYSDFSKAGNNESSAVIESETTPDINTPVRGENYGLLKVKCEKKVLEYFPGELSLILRPCIIVGAHDDTKRFDRWIEAIMNHRGVDVPDDYKSTIQFVDVRALSDFALSARENNLNGIYNLIGPAKPLTLISFIKLAKSVLNPGLELNFVDPQSQNFPMYIQDENWKGLFSTDGSKAYENGFCNIQVKDTVLYIADFLKTTKF